MALPFGESPVNHRTRFLQEILRSGHDALDHYEQGSCRFLCLRRSLKQPCRIGTFGFRRPGTILEIALDYLRVEYNAMLAGDPITAADEIMARVETILKNSQKVSWCKVVAKIRIHEPTSRAAKQKVLLLFPAVGNAAVKASDG